MTFVNLTPHAIKVCATQTVNTATSGVQNIIDVPEKVFPPSGVVARCSELSTPAFIVDDVDIIRKVFGAVTGLPEPEPGTWFIVSMLVRAACPNRTDLLSPGDLVRDAAGQIIGCKNLVCN